MREQILVIPTIPMLPYVVQKYGMSYSPGRDTTRLIEAALLVAKDLRYYINDDAPNTLDLFEYIFMKPSSSPADTAEITNLVNTLATYLMEHITRSTMESLEVYPVTTTATTITLCGHYIHRK